MRRLILILSLSSFAASAGATVAEGVAKWRAGDWPGAVAEWVAPAARGDADALFNLGQAYKLGRGVPANLSAAQDYYRRAADKGHLAAAANLGITLYQAGRKTEALGWLRQAADRGDGRAAYVLGIATFNGDGAPRNPVLGYAYMLRAREAGLAQADPQAARMAVALTPIERGRGEAAAAALAAGEPVPVELLGRPATQLAGAATPGNADEDAAESATAALNRAAARAAGAPPTPAPPAFPAARPPAPPAQVAAAPSATAATPPVAAPPVRTAAAQPVATTTPRPASQQVRMTAEEIADSWLVQLGAYNTESAARTAWATLVAQSADILVGARPVYNPRAGLVRLQVGPFAAREPARELCARLSAAGRPCFVTRG